MNESNYTIHIDLHTYLDLQLMVIILKSTSLIIAKK
jgi:hypothetical protein